MEQRVYHGQITPGDLVEALVAEFDHTGYRVQVLGDEDHRVIQIATAERAPSGGQTSLTVHAIEVEDGVLVRLGQQEWLGIAASLGVTALSALRNPFSLVGRLDDLAQDLTSIQLTERIWATIERTAAALGASHQLSETLRRLTCPYCGTGNPVGSPSCAACGAPLGSTQPITCEKCGFAFSPEANRCPQCGTPVTA